jgi:hypothetical protein
MRIFITFVLSFATAEVSTFAQLFHRYADEEHSNEHEIGKKSIQLSKQKRNHPYISA